jgi:hypothetical protein
MFEKHLVTCAKAGLIMIGRIFDPVFGATAKAFGIPLAKPALARENSFSLPKFILLFRIQHIDDLFLTNIAQSMSRFHEKITGVHISVVLDYNVCTAFLHKRTLRSFQTNITVKNRFEMTDRSSRLSVLKIL